jgi:hypothetical protein
MHIDSAEPNLLGNENRDEGGKEHDSPNTTGRGPGAGSEPPVPDPVYHGALPHRPVAREIHNLPIMESFPARAFFEAARCGGHLPDTGFEEATTISVV